MIPQFYGKCFRSILFFFITSIPKNVRLWLDESRWSFTISISVLFLRICIFCSRLSRSRFLVIGSTATICCVTQRSGINFFNFIADFPESCPARRILRKESCGLPRPDIAKCSCQCRRERTREWVRGRNRKKDSLLSIGRETSVIRGASSYVLWAPA